MLRLTDENKAGLPPVEYKMLQLTDENKTGLPRWSTNSCG